MKKIVISAVLFFAVVLMLIKFGAPPEVAVEAGGAGEQYREIASVVKPGETFSNIFSDNSLDASELYQIREASSGVFSLRRIVAGRPYSIKLDGENRIQSLTYCIDGDCDLSVKRNTEGFSAEKVPIPYEKRIGSVVGVIEDNLVASMENLVLALKLSDIFAWDIDFTTDLRNGDAFRVVVEELWLNGEFKKYGEIRSADFANDGQLYNAYRFEQDGEADYYDSEGRSLRRAFLKAPLSYRRISSGFTRKRFHPILRIFRPHLGVDYAAPHGTPVSSVGDGVVAFAGYKGQNGNLVAVKHPNGYGTYYGHLSSIPKGVRKGARVKQGQVIGHVGSTGLSTGAHLDYRVKKDGRFVNPLSLKMPRGKVLKGKMLAEFEAVKKNLDSKLATLPEPAPKTRG